MTTALNLAHTANMPMTYRHSLHSGKWWLKEQDFVFLFLLSKQVVCIYFLMIAKLGIPHDINVNQHSLSLKNVNLNINDGL